MTAFTSESLPSEDSSLDFMQALCIEAGIAPPPGRKGSAISEIIQRLRGTDRPVFIDEAQSLPRDFLNVILDLCDATACPFVLVGEEELRGILQQHKRIWSRTYHVLEFEPISAGRHNFLCQRGGGIEAEQRSSHDPA